MEDVFLNPVELTENQLQEVAGGTGSCNPNPCNPCGGHQGGLLGGLSIAVAVAVAGAVSIG